jgi:tetratricopeptide (TPR) repeat protein
LSKKFGHKLILFFVAINILLCCAPKKPEITPQQLAEYNLLLKEADALYHAGCYESLKRAFDLYEQALTFPAFQRKNSEKLLKTAILLGLRERELGFLQDTYFHKATDIIASTPPLSGYSIFLKIASSIPRKSVGIVGDFVETGDSIIVSFDEIKDEIADWVDLLKQMAKTEDFYAYLNLCFHSSFSYLIEEKPDFEAIKKAFPDSFLVRYKLALYPVENPESLEKLVHDEPAFHEVFYFLGNMAFRQGSLITAENNFLKAYEYFPQSVSILVSLGSIYFAFEELDKSLAFYEKTLEMAPSHRDALLGKAMCLSYIGKHREAIQICNSMLSLGKYYLGETHYWLAWNQNELGEYDNAWENIEISKKYLIGYGQVLFLAGSIAFNQNSLDEAEKNLLEAYKQDASNGDPAYYLGKIKAIQEDWLNSGAYFETASGNYGRKEELVQKQMDEIQNSSLSDERKKRYVSNKKALLRKTQLTKATSWYNAAAGYYNAGMREKAIQLAEKAAAHPALKDKAVELLHMIKK